MAWLKWCTGLSRGVNHREFYVLDEGEEAAWVDPFWLVSEEVAKANVGGDMPEKTRAASTMPPTGQQDVGYCEGHLAEGARGPFLATEIAMRCVRVPNT